MKKITLLLIFCVLVSIGSFAQNSVQDRSIKGFSSLSVCCGINVHLSEGSTPALKVSAPSDIIDKVLTKVKGNTLEISFEKNTNNNRKKGKIDVYLTVANELNAINTSSASSVDGDYLLIGKNMDLSASSGGDINLRLRLENLKVSASSGANMNLKGNALSVKVSASSGSSVKMKDLIATTAKVATSSGASLNLAVQDEIDADASSGGSIIYYGSATKSNISKSSGGSVKRN